MNDTEGQEKKSNKEIAKEKVKEMFDGLRKLSEQMGEAAEGLKAAQARHTDTLAKIGKEGPLDASKHRLEARVDALLDITTSLASAQVISLEMSQRQIELSMDRMGDVIDLEE